MAQGYVIRPLVASPVNGASYQGLKLKRVLPFLWKETDIYTDVCFSVPRVAEQIVSTSFSEKYNIYRISETNGARKGLVGTFRRWSAAGMELEILYQLDAEPGRRRAICFSGFGRK